MFPGEQLVYNFKLLRTLHIKEHIYIHISSALLTKQFDR